MINKVRSIFIFILIETLIPANAQETVKDNDGNLYSTVKAGNQVWMRGNLKVTHYSNGDPIRNVNEAAKWKTFSEGAFSAVNNDPGYRNAFGLIYNWYTADDKRNVCPAGWHVPADTEWNDLVIYLSGENGPAGLLLPGKAAVNQSLFQFLPEHFRGFDGEFSGLGYGSGGWWSATSANEGMAFYRGVNYNTASRQHLKWSKNFGYHIRCIKDPADLSELKPFLKKSVLWKCATLNREIPLNIYYPEEKTDSDGRDVIVYIKNSAWERIGREPDLSILKDFLKKKFIVITLDFGNDPKAVSPYIDNDINDIYSAVFGYRTKSLFADTRLIPKEYRCFVIPEGYRVATDLVYWEIDKHGVYGTMEYIMKTYNEEIVPRVPGLKTASTPGEMVDRKGKPFDYGIKMDILYPSQSGKKLPAFFYSETSQNRNAHCEPTSDGAHLNWFQLRGYVYIVMGHCFNPCTVHYWHFGDFTLDHWNGLACYSAAMRYIYANSYKYNINTSFIGGMGISKGQYAITRLSDPSHDSGKESKKFESLPEGTPEPGSMPGQIVYITRQALREGTPEPQPWKGYPSKITCGWQGMGMGSFESEYITPDYVPTIYACGENDREVITREAYPRFLNRLEELDVNYINLFMQGLGHSLSYGYDKRMGVDRYQLVIDFFDRYLKVEDKLPPVALVVVPRDSAENVSPTSEISVNFAPVIDENTILDNNGIRVISFSDNMPVKGSWKVSHGGTKFSFTPEQALKRGEDYMIIISARVRDKAGIYLEEEKTVHFKVAS
jgi:uncharacterized protein (TIGR02145 family)